MKVLTWGICLVIFCLPLYLLRFEVFNIPITVLEVLIYILFVLWLVKGFKFGEFKKLLITHHSLLIATLLILTGVTLATIFSSDLRTSAGIWKAWFVDPLLFFIVVISVIKNSEQIKKVFYSLFSSGTIVSIISLVYLIQGKLDPIGRLQAFYNSPNYLAMYLAPALIIGLWALVARTDLNCETLGLPARGLTLSSARSSRLKSGHHALSPAEVRNSSLCSLNFSAFILLSIACLLLSIIFTKSFGAWLGIIAAIGFSLVVYLFKSKKRKLIWIVICLGLIFSLGLGYLKFNQPGADQSLDARLVIWQKAWQIFKTNPILGIGPGTFDNYFLSYPEWGVPQPHNIFLAFLLQAGLIGFIGFIWLLVYFFRIGFTKLRITDYGLLVTCLMSIMVYILVHGLVDTTYWKNDLAVVFWLIISLMAVLRIRNLEKLSAQG